MYEDLNTDELLDLKYMKIHHLDILDVWQFIFITSEMYEDSSFQHPGCMNIHFPDPRSSELQKMKSDTLIWVQNLCIWPYTKHSICMNDPKTIQNKPKGLKLSSYYRLVQKNILIISNQMIWYMMMIDYLCLIEM